MEGEPKKVYTFNPNMFNVLVFWFCVLLVLHWLTTGNRSNLFFVVLAGGWWTYVRIIRPMMGFPDVEKPGDVILKENVVQWVLLWAFLVCYGLWVTDIMTRGGWWRLWWVIPLLLNVQMIGYYAYLYFMRLPLMGWEGKMVYDDKSGGYVLDIRTDHSDSSEEEEAEEEELSFRKVMEGLGIMAVVGIFLAYVISSVWDIWTFQNCMIWVVMILFATYAVHAEKLGMNVFYYPISKRMIRIGYFGLLALTIITWEIDWGRFGMMGDVLGFFCFIGTGVFLGTFFWTKEDDDESKSVYYVRVDHSDSTDES